MDKIPENQKKVKSVKEFLEKRKSGLKKLNKRDASVYEGSLIHLPFFDLSKKKRTNGKVIRDIVLNNVNYSIAFHKGVPTELGQNILMFFLTQIPRLYDSKSSKCDLNIAKLEKEGISFTLADVCRALDLNKDDFRQRKRIKEELRKLGYIGISREFVEDVENEGNNAKHYTWDHIGFMKVDFYESTDNSQQGFWQNKVFFQNDIIENLKASKYRLYDFGIYKNLESTIAKRLYIIFGGHSNTKNNNKSKEWKIGLLKLADTIPLKVGSISDLRKKIRQGLVTLKVEGIISDFKFYHNPDNEEIVHVFY